MKKYLLFFILFLSTLVSYTQIPIGGFRDHLPYRDFHSIAVADDYVYAATEKSLMVLDKSDLSTFTWSKVDGLSDVGIARLAYSQEYGTLVIAYTNSNLDFIKDGRITNISDIKNKEITGSKAINNIMIDRNIVYLSCAFGVVLVNLKTSLIIETWFTNLDNTVFPVNDLAIFENQYYMATPSGVFTVAVNNPKAADFNEWKKIDALGEENFIRLQPFHRYLYTFRLNDPDGIFVLRDTTWRRDSVLHPMQAPRSMNATAGELLVGDWNRFFVYDTGLNVKIDVWQGMDNQNQALLDKQENIWVADNNNLLQYERPSLHQNKYVENGPFTANTEDMKWIEGVLVVVPGSRTREGWAPTYDPPSCSYFINGQWHHITPGDFTRVNPTARSMTKVVVNPRNPKEFYIGSWGSGLYRVLDGKITHNYMDSNSPLESANTDIVLVSGLCYDNNNNLWLTNSGVSGLLKVIKSNGEWATFNLSPYNTGQYGVIAEHVVVDSRNYKWINIPRNDNTPLVVFYDNNTIDNRSDDKIARIDMNGQANVKTSTVTCMVEDKNGEMWIGTDKGIKVIYNPQSVFTRTVYPQNIVVELGGYAQNLLEFETVTTIAVDGGNRKWIGTARAGVFLVSADGKKELLHFTKDNSPLLSDQIVNITIDEETGEVFFGTADGIIGYRSDATGGKEDYDEAKVFPNPVREGYTGPIAVSGLMENSFCKIVDAAGFLVWQGYANGGELVWDGKDFYGQRPATGVYFVFASSETGKEKKVAKILFIN